MIKRKISLLLGESAAHGVSKLFKGEKRTFLRLYWVFFIAVGSSLSAWHIYDTAIGYLSYKVVTRIETVDEQPMRFPTISFCPHEKNDSFKNISINQLFKKCTFSLESCMLKAEEYFEEFYTDSYGKYIRILFKLLKFFHNFKFIEGRCFRFNSGKNMAGYSVPFFNSTVGGRDDSLYMWLNQSTGLIIWIHDYQSPPKIEPSNNLNLGYYASLGFSTQFILSKIVEKRLGKPYNDCYEDVSTFPLNKTLIDFIKSENETYTQTNCFKLCFEMNYIETNPCNCLNTSLSNVWHDCFVKLENQDLSSCTLWKKIEFYKNSVIEKCKSYCPSSCTKVSYLVSYNLMSYLQSKVPTVIIYFDSSKYTSITQEPKMKEPDLISNIGGILGLFIGVGFVSFFELFELLIEALFLSFKEYKKRNEKEHLVIF